MSSIVQREVVEELQHQLEAVGVVVSKAAAMDIATAVFRAYFTILVKIGRVRLPAVMGSFVLKQTKEMMRWSPWTQKYRKYPATEHVKYTEGKAVRDFRKGQSPTL